MKKIIYPKHFRSEHSQQDTTCDDDATQLVLDIVQKVLEPVVKDSPHRTMHTPRQNCYMNANVNYLNIASVNINYKRWSNNDCSGPQPINSANYGPAPDAGLFTHEEIVFRTTKYNRHPPMNFWDQYSDHSHEEPYPLNDNSSNNRAAYVTNPQFPNPQYLNNRPFVKNSWRDNLTNNPAYIPVNNPQQRTENSYFQYRKNCRKYCSFCRKNGESHEFYTSHSLYENGKPSCPVLKQCICNICGQSGHTMSHCSLNASKNSILKMIHRFNAMK
ncbi:uncharacterized protein LOC119655121 isoform X2 [Hermetia illucens]|uniref:uncharacterized protein LOC119655121 isoform X2 n=1 Tax=Hermetia illucens TaxID=343691 RepID=UPI0018CC585E|nr:uncharacterized protein LOC119655121 isoform X2 [Hermetia illucens]